MRTLSGRGMRCSSRLMWLLALSIWYMLRGSFLSLNLGQGFGKGLEICRRTSRTGITLVVIILCSLLCIECVPSYVSLYHAMIELSILSEACPTASLFAWLVV
jgi:hypothetical protein